MFRKVFHRILSLDPLRAVVPLRHHTDRSSKLLHDHSNVNISNFSLRLNNGSNNTVRRPNNSRTGSVKSPKNLRKEQESPFRRPADNLLRLHHRRQCNPLHLSKPNLFSVRFMTSPVKQLVNCPSQKAKSSKSVRRKEMVGG